MVLVVRRVFDCTSGGPAKKIVACCLTMILWSAIAGTYAPPAVHDPITTAIFVKSMSMIPSLPVIFPLYSSLLDSKRFFQSFVLQETLQLAIPN